MDWQDDKVDAEFEGDFETDFEAFLRQFQPLKPKPLPTRPRMAGLALAAAVVVGAVLIVAAVFVGAVLIPMRFGSKPATHDVAPASTSTPPAAAHAAEGTEESGRRDTPSVETHVPRAATTPAVAEGAAAPSNSLGLSIRGESRFNAPPARGVGVPGAAGTRRVRAGDDVKPPTKVVDAKPVYPKGAAEAGIEGVVILETVIGEDGAVIETRVIRSIPELDQAAVDAVLRWQFEPTLLDGEPVEVEMNITINFTLQK